MSLHRMKLIAAIAAAATPVSLAIAEAQTNAPADAAVSATPPAMTGALYQGLPGVWINQGRHLWFCQWQGNAAPRNERISCFGTELPAPSAR